MLTRSDLSAPLATDPPLGVVDLPSHPRPRQRDSPGSDPAQESRVAGQDRTDVGGSVLGDHGVEGAAVPRHPLRAPETYRPDLPQSLDDVPGASDYENPVQASPVARPRTGAMNIGNAHVYGDSPAEWRKGRLVDFTARSPPR
jgi:hypothetical protein